jgi:uncharacterized protein YndB with AHSA1/START domain
MKNDAPVIVERTFNAPVKKVWKALTDNQEMKKWYFKLAEFKPEVGFEFRFTAGEEGKEFPHHCKIMEVIIEKKLAYTWRYEGYEGNSQVSFELFPEGDKTKLKVTHTGLETFPAIPEFDKKNFQTGWTEILNGSLAKHLEG